MKDDRYGTPIGVVVMSKRRPIILRPNSRLAFGVELILLDLEFR
jgi:hypothetical protein